MWSAVLESPKARRGSRMWRAPQKIYLVVANSEGRSLDEIYRVQIKLGGRSSRRVSISIDIDLLEGSLA